LDVLQKRVDGRSDPAEQRGELAGHRHTLGTGGGSLARTATGSGLRRGLGGAGGLRLGAPLGGADRAVVQHLYSVLGAPRLGTDLLEGGGLGEAALHEL